MPQSLIHVRYVWLNIKIVIALAFSCQLNDAYGLAIKNQEEIVKTDNAIAEVYNNLARIVFRRKWDEKPNELIGDVQKWIDEHQTGTELKDLLALALSVDCEEELDLERREKE